MKCASAGEKQKKTAGMLHTLSHTLLKKGLAGSREDASGIDYENKPMCTSLLKLAEKMVGPVCPGSDLPALPASPNRREADQVHHHDRDSCQVEIGPRQDRPNLPARLHTAGCASPGTETLLQNLFCQQKAV